MNLKLHDPFGSILVDTDFDSTNEELFNFGALKQYVVPFVPPGQLNHALQWQIVITKTDDS